MKLAFLTQYYPPEIGAPQARLSELAAHFVSRGHAVTVLTAMPNYPAGRILPGYGGLVQREHRDGTSIVRTAIYPTQRADRLHRLSSYGSFVATSGLVGPFTIGRPDFLLVESPPLFLGLTGLWLSRVTGARLIFNVSDLWPESAVRLGLLRENSIAHRLSCALEARCYRRAWLVTGQSTGTVTDIATRFPSTTTFHLSNGVDTRKFRPDRATAAARSRLGGSGATIVFYGGLHGLAQGLEQVIDAATVLRDEPDVSFALMGDGPEKPQLRERARVAGLQRLHFLDPRPAAEMPAYLAAADIVIIALKTELPGAVPSKLYEAMASGRPIVLIAGGESAAIVTAHDAGIAVQPGDIEGVAQAVRTLRGNPALAQRLGANGRRAAEQCFDRARIAARFIDYLEAQVSSGAERSRAGIRPASSPTS